MYGGLNFMYKIYSVLCVFLEHYSIIALKLHVNFCYIIFIIQREVLVLIQLCSCLKIDSINEFFQSNSN